LVTVGFVVEGPSDKKLVESELFQNWLQQDFDLKVLKVVDAGGNGNMCSRKIPQYVELLRKQVNPDKVVVLADLDPDKCAPCITKRKEIIGSANIDLVVIACKAMESWFLADTEAMRSWTKNSDFFEEFPEQTPFTAEKRLDEIGRAAINRGFGNKINFAVKFIHIHGFSVNRAAAHPHCPSAKYFVEKLKIFTIHEE